MKLSEVLKNIDSKSCYTDLEISDVCCDTGKISPGAVFVCIKGDHFDGHTAAEKMMESGAACVVCERDMGLEKQILVEDTRLTWPLICSNFFGNPAEKLKLIGLTGTNGKTTTSFLIKQILDSMGIRTGLIGTVQNMIGQECIPTKFTTPDAYELHSLFQKMVQAQCEYCIMEVSSQALAQGRVHGCRFAVGAFTNLTQDHLDFHKTWENYFGAKRILFENCDTAVINIDDENGLKLVEGLACRPVTYAVDHDTADYVAKYLRFKPDGVSYELVAYDKITHVNCAIPGRFSVYNSLCAAVCCMALGYEFEAVVKHVHNAGGVKGRAEVVPTDREFTIIIDYAHSPDGLKNIISSMRETAKGRIITLFGCGGDRDKTKRPTMGRIAAELSDLCIVTSDNPRSEAPDAIIEDILVGVKAAKKPYKVVENRREAIKYAIDNARADDVIILAGKGHETYQILNSGTIHFDEREVITEILKDE